MLNFTQKYYDKIISTQVRASKSFHFFEQKILFCQNIGLCKKLHT